MQVNQKMRRFAPILLAIALVFSVLPSMAFAAAPTISTTSYDFDVQSPDDIDVTVSLGSEGDVATGITSVTLAEGNALTGDQDYAFSGTTLTINSSYLADELVDVDDGITLEVVFANSAETQVDITITAVDETDPTLETATIDGTSLVLTYDEDLDNSSTPANTDFTVTGIAAGTNVSSVAVSGDTVTLTMANAAVSSDSSVTVDYTPGSNPIVDLEGNEAAALSSEDVTNDTEDGSDTAVTWSGLTANGTSGETSTTELTLTFSADPTTLAASNITVTGATKGALTGDGTTRKLAISNITVANGANVTVAISNPTGFTISGSPKDVAVNVAASAPELTELTLESATADGDESTASTKIDLVFDVDPGAINADDIAITGTGAAVKGSLTGNGVNRSLALTSVTTAGEIAVTVTPADTHEAAEAGALTKTTTLFKAPATVTAIAVKTPPTDLTYIEGESLDLAGLVVTLTYSDASTEDVAFANFASKSITANPDNGTEMEVTTHGGQPVTVSCNSKTATTSNLTVEEATYTLAVTAVAFDPAAKDATPPAAKAITITSSGNSDATIADVALSGTNADKFTITAGTAKVTASGVNTTYKIQPTNAAMAVIASNTATITVTYDDGATDTADVTFNVVDENNLYTANNVDDLDTPIADAEAKMDGVVVSVGGTDILPETKWVTQAEMDALTAALEAAEYARDNPPTSTTDVDAANSKVTEIKNALTAATSSFTPKDGTKLDYTALATKIGEANTMKATAVESTDGSDVAKNAYWVTEAVMTTFENAIAAAETLNTDQNAANQSAIDTAVSTLNTAIGVFEAARELGTKESGGSTPSAKYAVTVTGSYASTTGAGEYEQGKTVTINAGSRSNYSFNGWTVTSGGVTLANASSATTTFIMPDNAVSVTANWTYIGGSSSGGSSSGGGSGSGSGGGGYTSSDDDDDDDDDYYYSGNRNTTTSSVSRPTVSSNVSSDGSVSATTIASQAATALNGAGAATVQIKNATSISASTIQSLASAANRAQESLTLHADTTSADGKAIDGRLYVNPALLTGLTADLKLGVSTSEAKTGAVTEFFEKWFDNSVVTIRCEQQGSFGARLEIAAKADLSGLNTRTLYFYSYDRANNSYKLIDNPAYFVDANGYLHFHTELAGDIIVTDSPLVKR